MKQHSIDRPFLVVTLLLVIIGFFIFTSASLGLMARDGATFSSVAVNQLVLGVGGGLVALTVLSNIHYRVYRRFAPYLFLGSLLGTLLVWVPGLGLSAGGAARWILIAGVSFQPAEALKLGFVIGLAWLFCRWPKQTGTLRYGLAPYIGMCALAGSALLFQPDTGTFLVLVAAGCAMYIASGARVVHLALMAVLFVAAVSLLVFMRPYLMDRITTFIDPASDPSGAGYQIRQSLLAIGSGGIIGRGFGQSVQKFNYLPEPIGDSIFSVAAEEFGLVGGVVLILLFLFFTLRGLSIAARVPDRFGGLLVVGLVIVMMTQTFLNIGSMLGIVPLTGEPLVFISHGGSALLFALASVGVILNVSRYSAPPVVAGGASHQLVSGDTGVTKGRSKGVAKVSPKGRSAATF